MRNIQKYLSYLALLITTLVISACSGGNCTINTNNNKLPLVYITSPVESVISSGSTTTAVVSLESSYNITTPITVTITSNDPVVMTVSPNSCSLTTESNNCTITLTGESAGVATFSATTTGYGSVTSESITVVAVLGWTWMSGAEIKDQTGVYGDKGIENVGNIPGARHGSVSWHDDNGNLWLFGGQGYDKVATHNLNDLWKYNPTTNAWTWVSGADSGEQIGTYGTKGTPNASNVPGARQQSISWQDGSGNLWLFGGVYNNGNNRLNDLWKYNPTTNEWTWMSGADTPNAVGIYGTKGTPSASNAPGARQQSISWRDESGNLWLFGGYDGNPLNDLWKYDPTTNEWTWVSGENTPNAVGVYGTKGTPSASNMPGARFASISWRDDSGNLWLFGGVGSDTLNDLWKYNINTNQWTWVSGESTPNAVGVYGTKGTPSANNVPGARRNSISWHDDNGNLWLFGGLSNSGYLDDLWEYNPTTNQWAWMSGESTPNAVGVYGTKGTQNTINMPGSRFNGISWYANGQLWLFGGKGYAMADSGELNDLWIYK